MNIEPSANKHCWIGSTACFRVTVILPQSEQNPKPKRQPIWYQSTITNQLANINHLQLFTDANQLIYRWSNSDGPKKSALIRSQQFSVTVVRLPWPVAMVYDVCDVINDGSNAMATRVVTTHMCLSSCARMTPCFAVSFWYHHAIISPHWTTYSAFDPKFYKAGVQPNWQL